MVEVITDVAMRNFVHSSVSTEFSLSIDQVANKCKTYGRFASWLNSDITRIKEVLNKVKSNGVSPAFFASYEKTEGYNSSWGWLNHTSINGTPLTDSDSVSQWVSTQSKNMSGSPAWIDYANYNDFVPTDVKTAGNADFEGMTSGSIGRVVIAGTAAATWEVYYPLGLKKEYNGVQNYGAPITGMMDTIISWGGTIEGGGGGVEPTPSRKNDILASNKYEKKGTLNGMTYYEVKKGDTLKTISSRYNVNMMDIKQVEYTSIPNKNLIIQGQILILPKTLKTAHSVPKDLPPARKKHIVKSGESLSTIAIKYKTTVSRVAKSNGIKNPDYIRVGQVLYV